jgi:hypothetical protein
MNILKPHMGNNFRFTFQFAIITFLISGSFCYSQNNVRLLSNNSLFKVFIGNTSVNKEPQAEVLIKDQLDDTLRIGIEFNGKIKKPFTLYLLNKGRPVSNMEFDYLVEQKGENYQLRFTGIYEIENVPQPIVPAKPVIDSTRNSKKKQFGNLCEIKEERAVFFNNIPPKGCIKPMPEEYAGYISQIMKDAYTPDQKMNIAENVCRNNCLNVLQLSALLKYIDYELDKLKLLKLAYPHITDKENKKHLEKNFRFESSLNELNSFFKSTPHTAVESSCTTATEISKLAPFLIKFESRTNDSERFETLKKEYSQYCYRVNDIKTILGKFIHDREKLDAAYLLYPFCVEKENYAGVTEIFSYNQSASELLEFLKRQQR